MPPFTDFEIALLNRAGCAPSMMMPNSWRLVGGFEALCNFYRVEATVEAFFYFFQMNFPQKGSWFYFQARGRGPHARKLFRDLRDPPKDWKKDFFLVRPRRGCQPTWWLREDGSSLFPTKWVEPFEAIPRPVLKGCSANTQETVRVLSALPPGLDIDDYFVIDENGGKFNPARILALTKREEAKHGKNRSTDRSGSSSAHHSKPRGDPRDEDPKKGHGKGHSGHSESKGKVSVSIGSKASGLPSHKRRHGKDTELRPPSPKRAKVLASAPESGGKDGSSFPVPRVPAVAATEKRPQGSDATIRRGVIKRCEEGVEKEKALLAAEKELEQLRPEVASLRSNEQLLKVQLENAQKELKVWKDRSSALDEENKALRRVKESAVDGQRKLVADHSSLMGEYESLLQKFREANSENAQLEDALEEEREAVKALASDCSGAMEWGWSNCLGQVRFFNPQADLELRHINLHHEVEENNIVDISTRAVLWKGPFDASQELSPDDMLDVTPSEALTLEPSPASPSALASEKAVAQETLPGVDAQVVEGAEEGVGFSAPTLAEPSEVPRVEPSIKEAEAAESKPDIISEEFANSILAD
ncbi:hypothetical protein G2W53_020193 [Senna tora]|uniref:Transposase (putative) gypsy type domain-containing protein n=1 Tax=Senna tora TaxID=362788 RepID=A0A834TW62_9FABA|nr:hypothetical protein G2W53_020193 [Senna tora]